MSSPVCNINPRIGYTACNLDDAQNLQFLRVVIVFLAADVQLLQLVPVRLGASFSASQASAPFTALSCGSSRALIIPDVLRLVFDSSSRRAWT